MKIRSIISFSAVSILLFSGCNAKEDKAAQISHQARDAAGKAEKDLNMPYYYGLIAEYKTILAEDPDNLAAIIALGNAYYDTGHWKTAISYFERALQKDPKNADVRTDMGTAYRNIGMPDRALEEYHKALGYDAGHPNARYNMGVVYAYDKRDYTAAIRIWEELLHIAPNHPQAGHIRANITAFKKAIHRKSMP